MFLPLLVLLSLNSNRRKNLEQQQQPLTESKRTTFDIDAWQSGDDESSCRRSTTTKLPRRRSLLQGTCFQDYWDELSSLISEETTDTVTLQFDGHSFRGRMAILKFLMCELDDDDNDRLWSRPGDDEEESELLGSTLDDIVLPEWHWLWAYGAQLDWQYRSGRLQSSNDNAQNNNDDTISPLSWWGYMNFGFSVCVLVGAKQSGLIGQAFDGRTILMDMDEESQRLLSSNVGVQRSAKAWENLFRTGYVNYRDAILGHQEPVSEKDFQEARFKLQQQVWQAHTTVIRSLEGTEGFHELLALFPKREQDFGLGWARLVEILAAICFPTDLVTLIEDGAGFLPPQIINDDVWEQWEQSSKVSETRWLKGVKTTNHLVSLSMRALKRLTAIYSRVTRTNEASREMPGMVKRIVHGKRWVQVRAFGRIIWLYLRP